MGEIPKFRTMIYTPKELVTKQQIADYFGKHPNTVDHWRKSHNFPKPKVAPTKRTLLWQWKDVCDFFGIEA